MYRGAKRNGGVKGGFFPDHEFLERRMIEIVSRPGVWRFSDLRGLISRERIGGALGGMSIRNFVKSRPHVFRVDNQSHVVTLQPSAEALLTSPQARIYVTSNSELDWIFVELSNSS